MKELKKHAGIALAFAVVLFLLSFVLYFSFSYMGVRDKEVEKFIVDHYKGMIVLFNVKILFFYVIIALIIGLFSFLLRLRHLASVILFQLYCWFFMWIRAIKMLPQLYDDQLFHHGGVLAFFQVAITDFTPLLGIDLLFGLILLLVAWRKKRLIFGLAIALCAVLFVIKFQTIPQKVKNEKVPDRPNVLVLMMDSLRPSRISYNGYHRPTPYLDRLLRSGANFLNTRSSCARTFSSFASLFTSTFPPDHGIRYMFPRREELARSWVNLVQVLNDNGYDTSVVSDFAGDIFAQITFGFQHITTSHTTVQNLLKQRSIEIHYFLQSFLINPVGRYFFPEMWLMPLNIDSYFVIEKTKKYINRSIQEGKPFFAVAFCSNNHFPYVSKNPYYRLYTDRTYRGMHKYRKMDNMKVYSGFHLPPEDEKQVNDLYDGAVRMFDDEVGEMLHFLKKCGVDRNTIILLLSDHGESLYDDDYGTGHGDHLRGPFSNNFTFGVFSPFENFQGRRITPTVRDIDVAPTMLEILDIPIPDSFQGRSLLPVLRGGPFSGYPAYMETELWFTVDTPYIRDRLRVSYPGIKELIDIDRQSGEIILRREFYEKVIAAKHRAVQLNNKKYIYMPGDNGQFQEEYYLDDVPVAKSEIHDAELLNLKYLLPQLFPGKIFIDADGRVTEKIKAPF